VGNGRDSATRSTGIHARRLGWALAFVGLIVTTSMSACSGDDDDAPTVTTPASGDAVSTATSGTDLVPCAEDRHGVVVDVGSLTYGTAELAKWLNDPAYDMAVRSGAPDLLNAFRIRGYEIVYLTGLASDGVIGPDAQPLSDAITAWQQRHGMPVDDRTRLVMWDRAAFSDTVTFRIDTLVRLSLDGLTLDYGYTDDENDVRAMRNGGIAVDHIFTIQGEGGTPGTAGSLEQDWSTHLARVVEPLPPVCLQ
jgi:hypothetical protein